MKIDRARNRPSPVGLILREHRKLHNLTQEQTAHYLGIEPRTLRMYENGERFIENVRELRRIAVVLGIDPQRFGLIATNAETIGPEQVQDAIERTWLLIEQARFVEARTLIETLLRGFAYEKIPDDHELLHALACAYFVAGHVVAINSTTGEVEQPISYFQKMEEIARYINDQTLLNIAMTYHGDMLRRRGDVAKAIDYLEGARDTTQQADVTTRGNSAQLLARAYLRANDVDGFERSLALSEELASSLYPTTKKIYCAYNLGTVHDEYGRGYGTMGEIQKSLTHLDKAEAWLPSTKRWEMVLKATRADTLIRGGEIQHGVQMMVDVIHFARSQGHHRLLERAYRVHRYLDQQMLEIGRINMQLRDALHGQVGL